ncbi:MAG: hypothetical protein OHK0046_36710 [Anaerolineae bacterium]
MDASFLQNFMRAAQKITHAERCLVVDVNLNIVEVVNVDESTLQSPEFIDFAMQCLREAWETGDPILTNNVVTNPSDAPTTNTNFANLRVIVAMPIAGHGVIYLDQHIRNGVMPKQMIDRLMSLAGYLMSHDMEGLSPAEMAQTYQQLR